MGQSLAGLKAYFGMKPGSWICDIDVLPVEIVDDRTPSI